MDQLPPRIPDASSFPYHQNHNWVDEFLDFSSACCTGRNHRRSASDSVAFLERDDHQSLSVFHEESLAVAAVDSRSSTPPPPPPDQNSNDLDERHRPPPDFHGQPPKLEAAEVASSYEMLDAPVGQPCSAGAGGGDSVLDPKRVKRILANRQSAQRSRVRKLHYISELERNVTLLQAKVSTLLPRVTFLDHQRLILNIDNNALKERIATLAQDKIFKNAHQEALKKEIERLRQVYHCQSFKKMNHHNSSATSDCNMGDMGKEQQLIT